MKTYEFTIIASGLDPSADDFEAKFYDAGCDDATVSFQKGHILVDFARDAESAQEAIASAVEAVRATGASVDRIEPDPLVSLSEIAARSGMSRAAVSHYFRGKRGQQFPPPVARVTTDSPLWDWGAVASWMFTYHRSDVVDREVVLIASAVRQANDLIACGEENFRGALHDRMTLALAEP